MRTTMLVLGMTLAFAANASAKPRAGDAWRVDADDEQADDQDADAAALQGSEGDTKHYVFENDRLDGEVLTSEGVIIPYRRPAKGPSLIHLRAHFMPELIRLSTDL
jgi:hypothetical protein